MRSRAAVLLLLFADRRGGLRVVVTMRAASLRTFSGQAALPGGRADTVEETPYETARREAWEEIGLPLDSHVETTPPPSHGQTDDGGEPPPVDWQGRDQGVPPPFRIEHLCDLPCSLAKTGVVVRPCIAFVRFDDSDGLGREAAVAAAARARENMKPRLDAREVAAVFSAPFHNFLKAEDEEGEYDTASRRRMPPGKWYEGRWLSYLDKQWRAHTFRVPVHDQRVGRPPPDAGAATAALADAVAANGTNVATAAAVDKDAGDSEERFTVWGMTARIIVDAARVAYGEDPEFEHNTSVGDEDIILQADRDGGFADKQPLKV